MNVLLITALKSLVRNVVVHAFKIVYTSGLQQRGIERITKSIEGFPIILATFPPKASVQLMSGVLVRLMQRAAFTTFCNFLRSWAESLPYQAVKHPTEMLSMVYL